MAQICTMVNVAKGMGANRIVPSRSVLYPTGDPELSLKEEQALRENIVTASLQLLREELQEAKIIELHEVVSSDGGERR